MDTIPPETLLDIFTHVRPTTDPDWTKPVSSFYSWITISHVCREWRELLLANPSMWDHLLVAESCSPSLNTAAKAFLDRAGELPLHLYLVAGPTSSRGTAPSSSCLAELLQQAIPRSTHISICLNRETGLEPLWSKLRIPAPLLSDLFVLNTAAYTFPGAFGPIQLTPFPPDHILPRSGLFDDHTPSLQSVRLTHAYNPLPMSLVRPGIKRLEMKGYDKHHMGSVPIGLLQGGVAASLTELVLLSAADYDVVYPPSQATKFDFPALENLVVYGTVNYIPAILNCMAFPTTTTVRVRLHYPVRAGMVYFNPSAAGGVQVQPDPEGLIEALQSLFTVENPVVAMSIADDHEMGCRFWNTLGENPEAPEANPRLTLVNSPKRMDVAAFVRRLPLNAVQIFHISSRDPVDVAPWIPAVRNMTSVHHAEIGGNGAIAFFVQLMGEQDGHFMFRTLRKAGFIFGEFGGDERSRNPFKVFADAVAYRAAYDASALKEVWFTHCQGFESAMDALRKVVDDVDIDKLGL